MVLAIVVAAPAPADAATTRFAYTGGEQAFTVPAEVRSLHVVAEGGDGAAGSPTAAGGRGARVTTDIAVTPGETLYIEVGGSGGRGGSDFGGGAGDVDLLGGHAGGGGGGATDIRRVPRTATGSEGTRLLVAGGGGGGGGGPFGGRGGNADEDGDSCISCDASGGEGGAGTDVEGGAGGDAGSEDAAEGPAGRLAAGGAGGAGGGGGGGGGMYGGGGGGGGDTAAADGGGGGGGGGGTFIAGNAAATFGTNGSGPGSVTISYGEAVAEVKPTRLVFAAQRITSVGEQKVTVTNRGAIPLAITGVTFSGSDPDDFQRGSGCGAPVPPSASCQLVVRFVPRASGFRHAKLTIVSNAKPSSALLDGLGLRAPRPVLSALRIAPSTFKAARRGKSVAAGGKALISYRADIAGIATFRVLRIKGTRLVPVGASFTHGAKPGLNRFRFSGRVNDHGGMLELPPGRYRLRGYGSVPSRSVTAAFRIVR